MSIRTLLDSAFDSVKTAARCAPVVAAMAAIGCTREGGIENIKNYYGEEVFRACQPEFKAVRRAVCSDKSSTPERDAFKACLTEKSGGAKDGARYRVYCSNLNEEHLEISHWVDGDLSRLKNYYGSAALTACQPQLNAVEKVICSEKDSVIERDAFKACLTEKSGKDGSLYRVQCDAPPSQSIVHWVDSSRR